MPNMDYPGVCLACTDEKYALSVPDMDAARERVHMQPEGFTKTLIRSLKNAFPDKFDSEEEAYLVFDAMKAVIATGLDNGNTVHLEGLGEFHVEKSNGVRTIAFGPESALHQALNR